MGRGVNLYAAVGNGVVMRKDSGGRSFIGIILPDLGFLPWLDDILIAIKDCGRCAKEAYQLAQE